MSVTTRIEINRTPEQVREVFLDFAKWPEWVEGPVNSVEPLSPSGSAEKGEQVRLSFGGLKMKATVADNNPQEFGWSGGLSGLFNGHHSFRFEPSSSTSGGTTFVNSENFTGLITSMCKPFLSKSQESPNFEKFNAALKRRVESVTSP